MFKFLSSILFSAAVLFASDSTSVNDSTAVLSSTDSSKSVSAPVDSSKKITELKSDSAVATKDSLTAKTDTAQKSVEATVDTSKDEDTVISNSENSAVVSDSSKDSSKELYSLYIKTLPESSIVMFDDSLRGTSPILIENLIAGKHTIATQKKGYFVKKAVLNVTASDTVELKLTKPVKLSVTTNPDGALLVIKDKKIGMTPVAGLNLRPGKYPVSFQKDGFVSLDTTIDVSETLSSDSLFVKLKPVVGEKTVAKSEPSKDKNIKKDETSKSSPEKSEDRKKKILNKIALSVFLGFSLVILIIELTHKN